MFGKLFPIKVRRKDEASRIIFYKNSYLIVLCNNGNVVYAFEHFVVARKVCEQVKGSPQVDPAISANTFAIDVTIIFFFHIQMLGQNTVVLSFRRSVKKVFFSLFT